jgi:hypothetical protein
MKTSTMKVPCLTCPFRVANFGKANPPDTESCEVEWYSKANLFRLWHDGLRYGEAMVCHSTDPDSRDTKRPDLEGHEQVCLGSLAIVYQHLAVLDDLVRAGRRDPYKSYSRIAGAARMSKHGILQWALSINLRRTGLFGGLALPSVLDWEAIKLCGVQWEDKALELFAKKRQEVTEHD